MNLSIRSSELEIMDDLGISGDVVGQTLQELDTINHLLGGTRISTSAFAKLCKAQRIASLADLGCGSADMLLRMSRISPSTHFYGFDANPNIIDYAQNHVIRRTNVHIHCENIFSDSFKQRTFDIIHCCLFLHHFTHGQLVSLFQQFTHQAQQAIIVNDLHRHPLAYYSIKWLTRLFSRSFMVRNDAAVSVSRGFKKSELRAILHEAGITDYKLHWRWAFRWQLVINCH